MNPPHILVKFKDKEYLQCLSDSEEDAKKYEVQGIYNFIRSWEIKQIKWDSWDWNKGNLEIQINWDSDRGIESVYPRGEFWYPLQICQDCEKGLLWTKIQNFENAFRKIGNLI
jgi:hypothetical protein